jgi:hypothetical protein
LPEIRRRGAELAVVGNGTPAEAADFIAESGFAAPVFVDQALAAYRAAGLRRGLSIALRASVVRRALHALRSGFRQTKVAGDPWQAGGAFVLAPGNRVLYAQVSREIGDHADPGALLGALDRPG